MKLSPGSRSPTRIPPLANRPPPTKTKSPRSPPISAGLTTETDYQARVIVKTNNGTNRSVGVRFHPVAVLSVETEPATDVTRPRPCSTARSILTASPPPTGSSTGSTPTIAAGLRKPRPAPDPRRRRPDRNRQPPVRPSLPLPPRRAQRLGTTTARTRPSSRLRPPRSRGSVPAMSPKPRHAACPHRPGRLPDDIPLRIRDLDQLRPCRARRRRQRRKRDRTGVGDAELSGPRAGRHLPLPGGRENEWGTEVTDDSTFNFFPQDCPTPMPAR